MRVPAEKAAAPRDWPPAVLRGVPVPVPVPVPVLRGAAVVVLLRN